MNASTSVERDDESATAEPATDVSREELDLRRRLLGEPLTAKAKLWGWIGPLIVTVLAGFLRLWDLGRPHQLVFDETYYVKQGWSMMLYGHERKVP